MRTQNKRLGIRCERCRNEITPCHEKCPKCGLNYNHLLKKYRTQQKIFDEIINRQMQAMIVIPQLYVVNVTIFYVDS